MRTLRQASRTASAGAEHGRRVGEEVVGPAEHQVTEQDRRVDAEVDVQAGLAASGRTVVDDVVVHQGAGLDQLDRRTGPAGGLRPRPVELAAAGQPAAPQESWAQPLASVEHEPRETVHLRQQPLVDRRDVAAAIGELVAQDRLDERLGHRLTVSCVPMETVRDRLLTSGTPRFSVEFFPPKDDAGEVQLWRTIRELEPLSPAFVSVTYGAGGSSRDRTIRVTGRIAAETSLLPVAHLTAVNHTVAELRHVIGSYAAVGVRNILALRGDPPGDPNGPW